jgi:hypothetical protein
MSMEAFQLLPNEFSHETKLSLVSTGIINVFALDTVVSNTIKRPRDEQLNFKLKPIIAKLLFINCLTQSMDEWNA